MRWIKNFIRRIPGSRWVANRLGLLKPRIPHGEAGVRQVGHRQYVGGMWDEIGRLQFTFLLSQGLLPHHYLCDVACGSLRAGVHFIPYLDKGHYLGIDKEQLLIDEGIKNEIGEELYNSKTPQFVVSSEFEFERFSARPDFVLAQSLFTHLPPRYIDKCFRKLRDWISPHGVFYATFFETATERDNPSEPHDHGLFCYTKRQMEEFGERCSFVTTYIGDWRHPRGQVIVKYIPS